jgi:hypothetical protein
MRHEPNQEPRRPHPGLEGQIEQRELVKNAEELLNRQGDAEESHLSFDVELSVGVQLAIQHGWAPDTADSYLTNVILREALGRYIAAIPDLSSNAPYTDLEELLAAFYSQLDQLTLEVARPLKDSGKDLTQFELYQGCPINLQRLFDALEDGTIDSSEFCEGVQELLSHRNIIRLIDNREFKKEMGLS